MQCHRNEQLLLPMTTQSLTVWNQSPVGELSWNQWVVILTAEMDIGENFQQKNYAALYFKVQI